MSCAIPPDAGRRAKTNREKVAESEARRKARGQKKVTVWVPIEAEAQVKALAERLCADHDETRKQRRFLRLAVMAGQQ